MPPISFSNAIQELFESFKIQGLFKAGLELTRQVPDISAQQEYCVRQLPAIYA